MMMMSSYSNSSIIASTTNGTYFTETTPAGWTDVPEFHEDSSSAPYIAGVMILLILLGNGLVILSVYLNPRLREWSYYYVVNLAVSDLSTALCCACGIITTTARETLTSGARCVGVYGMYVFSTTSSTYALLIISTDRFLRICWPLRHQDLLSPSRAIAAIVLNWIIAVIATMIPLLIPQTYQMEGICLVQKIWPLSYVIFILMVVYLIPLVSIFAMYFNIATVVIRHRREIRALNPQPLASVSYIEGTTGNPNGTSRHVKRTPPIEDSQNGGGGWKMTKMVLIVSGYYTLSWLPFFVNLVILATIGDSNVTLDSMGWILPVMNSVINPVIYALRIPVIRKTFLLILRCRCGSLDT